MTVIDYALGNNLPMLKRIAKPSDVNVLDPNYKWGVLHLGVYHANIEMLKFWMTFDNCNVNIKGFLDDSTPLHVCIEYNHSYLLQTRLNIITLLMKAGADVTLRNRKGQTPLSMLGDDGVDLILKNHIKTLMFESHDLAVTFLCSLNEASSEKEEYEAMAKFGYEYEKQESFPLKALLDVDAGYMMCNDILKYIL